MVITSLDSLLDVLRQHRLLDPAQLQELTALQTQFPEPKALAGELIKRGWLTPYQANQVLNGKGKELVLGSYILLERLGEGGMGQVFKSRHRTLNRIAAIKLIRKERLDNPTAVRRFQREVRSAAVLAHPNIVLAYDADEIAGTHFMVMEYVAGAIDLAKLVKKNGPLPVETACDYLRQTALGLQHAFEQRMVHRDIKPANLLLTDGGKTVKVLDMGLSRLDQSSEDDDKSSTVTREGAFMGTPDYIAPEQALDTHTVDIRADLYSLGCTFYYLLAGRVPFPGGTLLQKLNKHQNVDATPVDQLRPEVPPEVAAIVRKLMAKQPADRYQTPAEVASALEGMCHSGSGVTLSSGAGLTVDDQSQSESVKDVKRDTLASACSYIEKRDDTVALEPVARPARTAEKKRRLLWCGIAGVCFLLVAIPGSFYFLSRGSDAKSPNQGGTITPPIARPSTPKKEEAPLLQAKALLGGKWHFIGPFDNARMKGFDTAYPPEQEIDLAATYPGKSKQLIGWRELAGFKVGEVLDIVPLFALAEERAWSCVYLYHEIDVADELALPICLGSDDTLTVWLNDVKLLDKKVMRVVQPEDFTILKLQAGKNKLLIKICQAVAHWGFYLAPVTERELPFYVQPGFDAWLKEVAAQPADKQIETVRAKLKDLNPRFDGDVNHKKDKDIVTEFGLVTDSVTDISPVRALASLHTLNCTGTGWPGNGFVTDLTPLIGLNLVHLNCNGNKPADLAPLKDMKLQKLYIGAARVFDLTPIKDMELTHLSCRSTQVTDLTLLRGMPLTWLECQHTKVTDLSPLEEMPLISLNCDATLVTDLKPLVGLPLASLICSNTKIADLTPLCGMRLTRLAFYNTRVTDVTPLQDMKLQDVSFTPTTVTTGQEIFRQMTSLKTIGISWEPTKRWPAGNFWEKLDDGEFDK